MMFCLLFSSIAILAVVHGVQLQRNCTLDDAQYTRGTCKGVRDCKFASDNLHADLPPKICSGSIVCCPTEETIAEKKCNEWMSYLRAPLVPEFDTIPSTDPICQRRTFPFLIGFISHSYDFPHIVALGYGYGQKTDLYYSCGGTLISEDYILTSAGCLQTTRGRPTHVLLGDNILERSTNNYRKVVPIEDMIPHPNFKPPSKYNDIALIKLKEKMKISRHLLPACLPKAGDPQSQVLNSVGWGTLRPGEPQTGTLDDTNTTIIDKKNCNSLLSEVPEDEVFPVGLKRTQFCAAEIPPGDKSYNLGNKCNADIGSPLTQGSLYKGEELPCLLRIVGVTSFGDKICEGYKHFGIYTKVLSYVPWIENIAFAKE